MAITCGDPKIEPTRPVFDDALQIEYSIQLDDGPYCVPARNAPVEYASAVELRSAEGLPGTTQSLPSALLFQRVRRWKERVNPLGAVELLTVAEGGPVFVIPPGNYVLVLKYRVGKCATRSDTVCLSESHSFALKQATTFVQERAGGPRPAEWAEGLEGADMFERVKRDAAARILPAAAGRRPVREVLVGVGLVCMLVGSSCVRAVNTEVARTRSMAIRVDDACEQRRVVRATIEAFGPKTGLRKRLGETGSDGVATVTFDVDTPVLLVCHRYHYCVAVFPNEMQGVEELDVKLPIWSIP